MDNLEKLEAELTKHCQQWLANAFSTQALDKTEVPAAVRAFYKHLKKDEPKIVYADSPWQMLMMAAALKTDLSRKDLSRKNGPRGPIANTRLAAPNEDSLLEHMWRRLDAQADENIRSKLRSYGRKHKQALNDILNPFSGSFLNVATLTSESERAFMLGRNPAAMATTTNNQLAGVAKEFFQPHTSPSNDEIRALGELYERSFPVGRRDEITASLQANLRQQIMETFLNPVRFPQEEKEFSASEFVKDIGAYIAGDKDKLRLMPREQENYIDSVIAASAIATTLFWSSSSLGWLPYYEFLIRKVPAFPVGPTNKQFIRAYLDFCKVTPCALLQDEICFVCEAPLVYSTDESRRMHSESGPAIAFSDGYKIFAWHGTMVPEWIIEKPYAITVDKIIQEPNNEVRRVMIDRFGSERFIRESGASVVHQDEFGTLFRKELVNDEPLVMVKVKNSSPEPDGSFRDYFLRVPPSIRTAKAAVAWTFDMTPEEYSPSRES